MEKQIVKIGIVVHDATKTARSYSELFDLDPWSIYDLAPDLTQWQDKPLEETSFDLRIAANTLGGMRIELIQPTSCLGSYHEFLKTHGEGIHHLCFLLSEEYDQIVSTIKSRGISIDMQGFVPGSHRFMQFGSQEELGLTFEICQQVNQDLNEWDTYKPQKHGLINMEGKRIGQIGIVVQDIERSAKRYWDLFGIGPWYFYDYKPPVGTIDLFHDRPLEPGTDYHVRAAITHHPSIQFELLQPILGPGTHAEFSENRESGGHHLSLDVVENFDEIAATMRSRGIETEMSGFAGPAFYYTYFSTQQVLGTVFEILKLDPKADMMAGLVGVYPSTLDEIAVC